MLGTLLQDVRYAVRSSGRTPGFAVAAIITLALGIGANTAIFSLMNAVLFRTLPVAAPEDLYFIAHGAGNDLGTSSNYAWLESIRRRDEVFSGVAAYNIRDFKVATTGGPQRVVGQYASGNYHALAGIPIARGRGFTNEDDRAAGGGSIAVISDGFWTRRFGRDPDVLGKTLVVGGRTVTIVGVTAPGFEGMQPGRALDITLPLSIRAADEPDFLTWPDSWTNMPLVARLKPGTDLRQAQAVVQAAFREHLSRHNIRGFSRLPSGAERSALLLPAAKGHDRLRTEYSTPLRVLMGMVGLVLLVSCVNVANLLLVRGTARGSEIAVRMSVGASRGRLVRQFLTESIFFSLSGGALGLLLASWSTWFISSLFLENQNPIVIDAQPDPRRVPVHDAAVAADRSRLRPDAGLQGHAARSRTRAEAAQCQLDWRWQRVRPSGARRRADRLVPRARLRGRAPRAHATESAARAREASPPRTSSCSRSTPTTPPSRTNAWWSCAPPRSSAFADGRVRSLARARP